MERYKLWVGRITFFLLLLGHTTFALSQNDTIKKGDVVYDFTFAKLAVKYLETGDTAILRQVANTKAAAHLLNHHWYTTRTPEYKNTYALVSDLLLPREKNLENIAAIKRNLRFAEDSIAQTDLAQQQATQYINHKQPYQATFYFTVGYDLGVVFKNGCSLNVAQSHYLKNMTEMKYYAIHELHHAGFILSKGLYMPSLNAKTHKEMTEIIEYLSHLEGMATYAALNLREKQYAMNSDNDYISLQNDTLMKAYEKEFFEIYSYFKNTPDQPTTNDDWKKMHILSDKRRLWYRVGALMAKTIDNQQGRDALIALIEKPSSNFFEVYLKIKEPKP